MATATPKGLSMAEMRLLADFGNVIQAREYNSKVDIQKLVLTYDAANGFTVELVETPKQETTVQASTTTTTPVITPPAPAATP